MGLVYRWRFCANLLFGFFLLTVMQEHAGFEIDEITRGPSRAAPWTSLGQLNVIKGVVCVLSKVVGVSTKCFAPQTLKSLGVGKPRLSAVRDTNVHMGRHEGA